MCNCWIVMNRMKAAKHAECRMPATKLKAQAICELLLDPQLNHLLDVSATPKQRLCYNKKEMFIHPQSTIVLLERTMNTSDETYRS